MSYRVEELAARAETSVDTIRYYQARNLLASPTRVGRVAWYDDQHVERLAQIRRRLEPDPSHPRYFITEPGMGYRFEG